MARLVNERDLSATIGAFQGWADRCLINDGSLLSHAELWQSNLVDEVRRAFVDHPDTGRDDFITKLKGQLREASPSAQQLTAEMLWALLLFPSNVRSETKRQHIRTIWEMSGQRLPTNDPFLTDEVLQGIGSGGPGFNNHRWRELEFLIRLTNAFKEQAPEDRRQVLADYDKFMAWIDTVPSNGKRQYRHMLRYFAFPDRVERMSSNRDRRRILAALSVAPSSVLRTWSDRQLDAALLELRSKFQTENPGLVLDFYEPPLEGLWRPDEAEDGPESQDGRAKDGSAARVWIEKTIVQGRPDRQEGEYALGRMLWSPQRSASGNDIYRFMRQVEADDLILHLTDNEAITGVSVAAGRAQEFNGVSGTEWADRPSYKIPLRNFRRLDPPLTRETFFAEPYRGRLVSLIRAGQQNLFYNSEPSLNQGAYLTPAPQDLVTILDEAYASISGKRLLQDLKGPAIEATTVPAETVAGTEDLGAIVQSFADCLHQARLHFGAFHGALARTFIASLATKRFVILTGLSGSGKSQIAIKFGQWLGRDRYIVVAVRPDWTGPDALFGYEDALRITRGGEHGWHVPEVLEFMLRASRDPSRPYALVLDEMNLAHVERYFADALSGIETSEPCLPNLQQDQDQTWVLNGRGPTKLPLPRNLFVIGTVNVDETTYLFSPKVLDRANTFEFRVTTEALSADVAKPIDAVPGESHLVRGLLSIATSDHWHQDNTPPWRDEYVNHLGTLHKLLSESSMEFGHRVHYEAIRFAAMHWAAGDHSMTAALDRQVLQKLLPRIHGARKRVEAPLCALAHFCHDLTYKPGQAATGAQIGFDPTRVDLPEPVLPHSFAKARRMVMTLRANQFTSFTE